MYNSPIDIIHGQIETQLEGEVLRAVQKCGVDVDKDELIRALNYDRQQYEQGYKDAMEKMRWIPVSERLPEPYTPVVTCRQETSGWRYIAMDKMIFQNDNEDEPIWIGDMRWSASTITHWISLPECPWGEEKNKYEF